VLSAPPGILIVVADLSPACASSPQGVWASGTTYITFEDVKVPVENLIGEENQGFKYIMSNFNRAFLQTRHRDLRAAL
jgi:alkylation response protein AidB-like acyl-CoA dehydrogenase